MNTLDAINIRIGSKYGDTKVGMGFLFTAITSGVYAMNFYEAANAAPELPAHAGFSIGENKSQIAIEPMAKQPSVMKAAG